MKRSKLISLVLITSATLVSSCGDDIGTLDTRREVYKTKEDCARDWDGNDNCQLRPTGGGYLGPSYFFYGGNSYYIPHSTDKPRPMSNSMVFSQSSLGVRPTHSTSTVKSSSVVRGGFGASSSHHSSVS
ncbi:hypothetical protein [Candidatus Magnetomonas plexicatena]|uniref:hypothetical protein n=1 Tax=Candidatus Magnetomonas plexicatena TaxID=2552947 RepID=UPI001C75A801|nr:hypothetical protein E2O03_006300 [Nitrospirales bacterium LBB_01]